MVWLRMCRLITVVLLVLVASSGLSGMTDGEFKCLSGAFPADSRPQYPAASDQEMSRLLNQIISAKPDVRAVAALALGQTGDPRAVEPLLKALNDKSPVVEEYAALAFTRVQDSRCIKPLVNLITRSTNKQNYGLIINAGCALSAQGNAGIDALAPALAKQPWLLGDGGVWTAAGKQAGDWAVARLGSSDGNARVLAMQVITECPGGLDEQRKLARKALSSPAAAEAVLKTALSPTSTSSGMAARLIALGSDKEMLTKLYAAAQDKKRSNRLVLLGALTDADDPEAKMADGTPLPFKIELDNETIAMLVKTIEKPNEYEDSPYQAEIAARILASSVTPKAVDAVLAQLRSKNTDSAGAAKRGIRGTGNPYLVDILIRAANDESSLLYSQAGWMLHANRHPAYLSRCVSLLQSQSPSEFSLAAYAISNAGDPRYLPPLAKMLADPSRQLEAATNLARHKDPAALEVLLSYLEKQSSQSDSRIGVEISDALAEYGAGIVERVIGLLKSPNAAVRLSAVRYFTCVKDKRAVEPLIAALKDTNSGVRKELVIAVMYQGDVRLTEALLANQEIAGYAYREAPYLMALTPSEKFRQMLTKTAKSAPDYSGTLAAIALGELGDTSRKKTVMYALRENVGKGPEPEIPALAARAAAKLGMKEAVGPILDSFENDFQAVEFIDRMSEDFPSPEFEAQRDAIDRLQAMKYDALKSVTGSNFGHAYYRWLAYWAGQGHEIVLGRDSY